MELWMELQWQLRWQLRPPSGTEPKQPNPSRIQAQPVQKPAPEKVPNVAFWRPQERWRKANANAWHHQTGSFESMKKPCKNHVVDAAVDGAAMAASVAAPASVRHAAETAKPQQDSSPTCPKPAPEKVPNVAFGRPQERWRKANANAWHRQTGSFESMKKPCKNHVVDGAVDGAAMAASVAAPASIRHGAETAKPQQDSSPTCPKTSPRKSA